jgi:ketosteroid isomerase-like protein
MKLARGVVLFAICLLVTTALGQNSTLESEESLKAALQDLDDAIQRHDAKQLDEIIANECIFLTPTGTTITRAEVLSAMASPDYKPKPPVRREQIFKVVGDAGLITDITHAQGSQGGSDYDVTIRLLTVWSRKSGKWQVIANAQTPVAQPKSQ